MPIKRTRGRLHRITAEALAAFEAGDWAALHRALGLKPWECSPLDAVPERTIEGREGSAWARSLDRAKQLRAELVQHASTEGAVTQSRNTCSQWVESGH